VTGHFFLTAEAYGSMTRADIAQGAIWYSPDVRIGQRAAVKRPCAGGLLIGYPTYLIVAEPSVCHILARMRTIRTDTWDSMISVAIIEASDNATATAFVLCRQDEVADIVA
jgi:hypothetical protein